MLSYNKESKYYLLNNIVKIDSEGILKISSLKNKSNDCLKLIDGIWHHTNYKNPISLITILFPEIKILSFKCINGDLNDYQKNNIEFIYDDRYYDNFKEPDFVIIKYGTSHKITHGKFSEQYRNMYWKVVDEDKTYYVMHISNDIYTKISKSDIKKVLNYNGVRPVWYLCNKQYVATTIYNQDNTEKNIIYLHQYIMDVHDEDLTSFEKTVDHINRDKLDNRKQNLRFANMAEQNSNRDKTARRCDAKIDVPHGIDLPKYMQYRKEVYCKEKNLSREFFIIVHPSLDKVWETTKSNNVAISDKFRQAKLFLQLTENQITQSQYNKEMGMNDIVDLPKYIVINSRNDSLCFSFDYNDGSRYTLKIVIQSQDLQSELDNFIDSINAKYPTLKFPNYIIKNTRAANSLVQNIKVKEIITFENFDIEVMKKQCPDNFFITIEKNKPYIAYSKNINKKRYNMKQVMKTNDFQKELAILINNLNAKFNLSL